MKLEVNKNFVLGRHQVVKVRFGILDCHDMSPPIHFEDAFLANDHKLTVVLFP